MLIFSFTITGLGEELKEWRFEILFLLTSWSLWLFKRPNSLRSLICLFIPSWVILFCECSFTHVVGKSDVLLPIWCSSKERAFFSFSGFDFLGVCMEWEASKLVCFVVNVYSKSLLAVKRSMWDDQWSRKSTLSGEVWCVLGDFNLIFVPNKKMGIDGSVNPSTTGDCIAVSFFMSRMDLMDLPAL